MKDIPVNFIIGIISLPLLIWLQVFLSQHKNKMLGLILPGLTFISVSIPRIIFHLNLGINKKDFFGITVPILLILNIPTVIFIIIYIVYRKKVKIKTQIENMNIQDLE